MMRTVLTPAAALATLVLLGACAAETGETAAPTTASAPTTTTASASPTPSGPNSQAPATDTATVPVYYLGATPYGPRLYREFHQVEGDPLEAALGAAVGRRVQDGFQVEPQDPDYRIPWPALTAATGSFEDGVITVNLGGDPESTIRNRPPGMTKREARLAIEQLIYTAQGVVQERAPVQFLLWGERSDQVLGVPTAEPLAEGDPIATLALVNVTTPDHGATESGSFVAEGVASSFEATVPWQIRQGRKIVLEGFTTAEGWMDKLYPWKTEPIDVSGLEPGEYTFVAMTSDPSGGAEGNGPYRDTKLIHVE